jgi:hypothetical protein
MQNLALKEKHVPPAANKNNTTWPPYGLRPGYTPPPETSTSTPPPQGTSAVQNENTTPRLAAEGSAILGQSATTNTPQDEGSTPMYRSLEERLKVVEGFSAYGFDVMDMCLVPDVVVPPKFKAPDFEKYKGNQCLRNHLKMFCRKMAAYTANEKLMIQVFQDSMSGASMD